MAKLYIPQVGDKLKLIENWNCKIFSEYRNEKVFSGLNIDLSELLNTNVDVTFPKGTVLKVERLYIRAPASSYDSITFKIESCPIKSLVKARFWVKLMDANTIEFEEIKNGIGSYSKLKDAFRFVALSSGFQNSSNLNDDEGIFVCEQLFNHFKGENVIELTFKNITPEILFQTINFSVLKTPYGHVGPIENSEKNKNWDMVKDLFKTTEVKLYLIPVLDGFLFYYEKNVNAVNADKKLSLYEEYNMVESRNVKFKRGSYLSYNWYSIKEKNWKPSFLLAEKNMENIHLEYKGEVIPLKSEKDFDKLIKSVRKEINTKLVV